MAELQQSQSPGLGTNAEPRTMTRVFRWALAIAVVGYAVMLLIGVAFGDWVPVLLCLTGALCLLIPFVLLRRGHLQAAGFFLTLDVLLVVTLAAAFGTGLHDNAVVFFPAIVLFAALVMDKRVFLFFMAITLAAVLVLTVLQVQHAAIFATQVSGILSDSLVLAMTLVFTAAISYLLASTMRTNLANANRELTIRKQMELEVIKERDFARQVMSSMGQGLVITDENARYVFVNPAFARMLGYAPADFIGKTVYEFAPPEETARLERERANRGAGKTTTYELNMLRRDGTIVPTVVTGVPRTLDKYTGAIIVITDLSEMKDKEQELRYLSTHDILTGLYNRAHFEAELARLESNGAFPVSLIVGDCDNLKAVNDTQGHAAGDALLRATARLLAQNVRQEDIVSRIGGDEFAILLPNTDEDAVQDVLERLEDALAQARIENPQAFIDISIGVATTDGDLELAFRRADQAMYAAKRLRKQMNGV